ncbi:hypothetical protein STANM309S_06479 [Streptomyces tanashiensis]
MVGGAAGTRAGFGPGAAALARGEALSATVAVAFGAGVSAAPVVPQPTRAAPGDRASPFFVQKCSRSEVN